MCCCGCWYCWILDDIVVAVAVALAAIAVELSDPVGCDAPRRIVEATACFGTAVSLGYVTAGCDAAVALFVASYNSYSERINERFLFVVKISHEDFLAVCERNVCLVELQEWNKCRLLLWCFECCYCCWCCCCCNEGHYGWRSVVEHKQDRGLLLLLWLLRTTTPRKWVNTYYRK